MAKLFYASENGGVLIKEALLSRETVDKFFELFGEEEINNLVIEKTGEYPFQGCFYVK